MSCHLTNVKRGQEMLCSEHYVSGTSFIKVNTKMTTSVRFFLSHEPNARHALHGYIARHCFKQAL